MQDTLNKVKEFTDRAHGEQMRKYSPERYIVHPIRVMETCREYSRDVCLLSAALLHDVLEDTDVTAEELREFLLTVMLPDQADKTIKYVKELTDEFVKSKYPRLNRYIRKSKERKRMSRISPEAQTIKYADIMDNCREISVEDPEFAPRYLEENRLLLSVMHNGDATLYEKARKTVETLLNELD